MFLHFEWYQLCLFAAEVVDLPCYINWKTIKTIDGAQMWSHIDRYTVLIKQSGGKLLLDENNDNVGKVVEWLNCHAFFYIHSQTNKQIINNSVPTLVFSSPSCACACYTSNTCYQASLILVLFLSSCLKRMVDSWKSSCVSVKVSALV